MEITPKIIKKTADGITLISVSVSVSVSVICICYLYRLYADIVDRHISRYFTDISILIGE